MNHIIEAESGQSYVVGALDIVTEAELEVHNGGGAKVHNGGGVKVHNGGGALDHIGR